MSYKSIIIALVALFAAFAVYLPNQPNLGECPEPTWEELYEESYDSDAADLYLNIDIVDVYILAGIVPPQKFSKEGIPCSFDSDWEIEHPGCKAWNEYIK